MGDSVEVVTSELHLAADRLRGAGQRLQDRLSSVDFDTRNLLASGWKGDAATAFEKYWEQWHQGAGQVIRGLQTMSDLLAESADQYAATDERSAGALSSTMPQIDPEQASQPGRVEFNAERPTNRGTTP